MKAVSFEILGLGSVFMWSDDVECLLRPKIGIFASIAYLNAFLECQKARNGRSTAEKMSQSVANETS